MNHLKLEGLVKKLNFEIRHSKMIAKMMIVTKYVKRISLRGQMTFILVNKDITGLAARSKRVRTTMTQRIHSS